MEGRKLVTINVGDTNDMAHVYQRIAEERARQMRMWHGSWGDVVNLAAHYPFRALSVLLEEVGEVAKALNEGEEVGVLVLELTQVAAVAVAWLNGLEQAATGSQPPTPHPQGG